MLARKARPRKNTDLGTWGELGRHGYGGDGWGPKIFDPTRVNTFLMVEKPKVINNSSLFRTLITWTIKFDKLLLCLISQNSRENKVAWNRFRIPASANETPPHTQFFSFARSLRSPIFFCPHREPVRRLK